MEKPNLMSQLETQELEELLEAVQNELESRLDRRRDELADGIASAIQKALNEGFAVSFGVLGVDSGEVTEVEKVSLDAESVYSIQVD